MFLGKTNQTVITRRLRLRSISRFGFNKKYYLLRVLCLLPVFGILPAADCIAMFKHQANSAWFKYKTEICRNFQFNGKCCYGNKCQFAHGYDELRSSSRHPKYKSKQCEKYALTGECPYKHRCSYYHEPHERLLEPEKQDSKKPESGCVVSNSSSDTMLLDSFATLSLSQSPLPYSGSSVSAPFLRQQVNETKVIQSKDRLKPTRKYSDKCISKRRQEVAVVPTGVLQADVPQTGVPQTGVPQTGVLQTNGLQTGRLQKNIAGFIALPYSPGIGQKRNKIDAYVEQAMALSGLPLSISPLMYADLKQLSRHYHAQGCWVWAFCMDALLNGSIFIPYWNATGVFLDLVWSHVEESCSSEDRAHLFISTFMLLAHKEYINDIPGFIMGMLQVIYALPLEPVQELLPRQRSSLYVRAQAIQQFFWQPYLYDSSCLNPEYLRRDIELLVLQLSRPSESEDDYLIPEFYKKTFIDHVVCFFADRF